MKLRPSPPPPQVLDHTELKIPRAELDAVFAVLDHSGDGKLDVTELEQALKEAKRRQRDIPRDAISRLRDIADTKMCHFVTASADGDDRRSANLSGPMHRQTFDQLRLLMPAILQHRCRQKGAKPPRPGGLGAIRAATPVTTRRALASLPRRTAPRDGAARSRVSQVPAAVPAARQPGLLANELETQFESFPLTRGCCKTASASDTGVGGLVGREC